MKWSAVGAPPVRIVVAVGIDRTGTRDRPLWNVIPGSPGANAQDQPYQTRGDTGQGEHTCDRCRADNFRRYLLNELCDSFHRERHLTLVLLSDAGVAVINSAKRLPQGSRAAGSSPLQQEGSSFGLVTVVVRHGHFMRKVGALGQERTVNAICEPRQTLPGRDTTKPLSPSVAPAVDPAAAQRSRLAVPPPTGRGRKT